ncbi:hypothetical protein H696_03634 [Fonticula alba]|uniref:Phosphatidylinositol transfer protein N-terminal domain-containing protein n=1 Tax=Fonticula alba TaxID=691883 RepID=A0A058Z7C4_FONAL|nr:hypothetical protein H696_03634 [Fonticula alba]KCV70175.1 hypothetical protein H696_03634 [Fonticula alba]|eukprot:XP_009495781.1 hypothetical protein H696_03634 [Fonticula alba]
MVLIREFRVPLPITVEEYQVAQLFSVIEVSREATDGDSGVEILKNEPFDDGVNKGQYTHKIYHLGSKVPKFIAMIAPASALMLEEEAWNCYPYCRTVLTSPFLGERFKLVITTQHLPDQGTTENALSLEDSMLKERKVVPIDITVDPEENYDEKSDPKKFVSKSGRGPWSGSDWIAKSATMTCYKLVEIKFAVFGLQTRAENFIASAQENLFRDFHRKLVCQMDNWQGLTMEDIRELEAQVKIELDQKKAEMQQAKD